MAGSSIALARMRSAQQAARAIVKKPEVVVEAPHVLKARENFSYFCELMGKKPARHMKEWHQVFLTGQSNEHLLDIAGPNTCLLSPRGPLDAETPVATPQGWRPLSEIRPGDQVIAGDGSITEVLDAVDYPATPCWEVWLSDGTSLVCDDSHRWDVRLVASDPKGSWRTVTLEEIRTLVHTGTRGNWRTGVRSVKRVAAAGERPWLDSRGHARYQVPVCGPVQYPAQELPVDPYLLGVLLGDGALSSGSVRFHKTDPDLLERIRGVLPVGLELVPATRRSSGSGDWRISGQKGRVNSIIEALRDLGLWGLRSEEKFVPQQYLQGSVDQRVALLQGLLDTDGTCKGARGGVSFGSSSPGLIEGVSSLVRSLGGLAMSRRPYRSSYVKADGTRVECRMAYRIGIRLPAEIAPFYGTAKASRYLGPVGGRSSGGLVRSIVDICPAGERAVRCLTVAHPDERFIIKDYVVSKNSAKSTVLGLLLGWLIGRHALAKKLLRILYVSYNVDVARNKSAAIKNLICSKEYQEIFPCVRLSKTRTSDELWSIDWDFAEVDVRGEDAFTIACAGLKGTITSKRSSLIVVDDAIKSAASIANPDIRREMESNWTNVIVPTMFQGARAIALGTRFHFDDLFATIFTERKGWKVISQSALHYDDDGRPRSYWPDMWSAKYLLKLQADDRVAFSYQYLNQPVRSTELGISPELFVKGEVPDVYDTIGVGIDLSAGLSERNDWTVFTLAGRLEDKVYVIDYRRMRSMGNIEKVEALCELLVEWNLLSINSEGQYFKSSSPVIVWPESVAYQKSFEGDLKRMLFNEWQLYNITISPVKGFRGDKLARLRGIMGLFEGRKIIFNKYRDFSCMVDEIVNFGHAPHDDCADSLNMVVQGLMRRGSAQIEWN
jgi:phage terminase large subunit-like protein